MPLISVIVPVYKVEPYLRRCVDSILSQTFTDFELILVDDGSPDGCPAICDEYAEKYSRVHVIHQQNGGLSAARNTGLEVSSGNYIMFVDSDDFIAKAMIEKLYLRIMEDKAEISMCSFLYVDENGEPIEKLNIESPIRNETLTGIQAIKRLSDSKGWYYTVAWNKLYKSDLFNNIRFPVGKQDEDEYTSHLFFGKCKKISSIEDAMYYYVQRKDSIMGARKYGVTIRDLDYIEAIIKRAEYVNSIGMNKEAANWYYDATLRISDFVRKYSLDNNLEKKRVKEVRRELKKNYGISRFCNIKKRCQITLICFSPQFYNYIMKIVC